MSATIRCNKSLTFTMSDEGVLEISHDTEKVIIYNDVRDTSVNEVTFNSSTSSKELEKQIYMKSYASIKIQTARGLEYQFMYPGELIHCAFADYATLQSVLKPFMGY